MYEYVHVPVRNLQNIIVIMVSKKQYVNSGVQHCFTLMSGSEWGDSEGNPFLTVSVFFCTRKHTTEVISITNTTTQVEIIPTRTEPAYMWAGAGETIRREGLVTIKTLHDSTI